MAQWKLILLTIWGVYLFRLSDDMLVWLSVWSELQIFFAYGPAEATAIAKPHHLLPHCQTGFTFLVPDYPGCPEKEAVKWASSSSIFFDYYVIPFNYD